MVSIRGAHQQNDEQELGLIMLQKKLLRYRHQKSFISLVTQLH